MTAKPSALPTPRPPETMIEASSRLTMPAFSQTTSATVARRLAGPKSTASGTTSGSAGASSRANELGRTATTVGPAVTCIVGDHAAAEAGVRGHEAAVGEPRGR